MFYLGLSVSVMLQLFFPYFSITFMDSSFTETQGRKLNRSWNKSSKINALNELQDSVAGGKGETKGHCKERILQLKKMVRIGTKRTRFFEGCPPVLDPIFAMVDALDYESDPPYDQIKFMFEKVGLYSFVVLHGNI